MACLIAMFGIGLKLDRVGFFVQDYFDGELLFGQFLCSKRLVD